MLTAMGILANIRAARTTKALDASDLEQLHADGATGLGREVRRRQREELLKTYGTNPWVRLAGDVVAARQSAAEWLLLRPTRQRARARTRLLRELAAAGSSLHNPDSAIAGVVRRATEADGFQEVQEHPFLDMLTAGTTGAPLALAITGHETDRLERLTLDLYGEVYYALVRDPRLGSPVRWWPLPPGIVRKPRKGQPDFRVGEERIPVEDVAWFRHPDPASYYGDGSPVAGALDHTVQIDEHWAAYLAALLRNRARPDLLIMAPGLGPTERERFEEKWRQDLSGPHRSGVAHFIGIPDPPANAGRQARSVTVHDLARSPADLEADESGKTRRDTILQVWRVPQSVIGATESANRATALMGEIHIRRNRTIPDLESRRNWLQARFFEPIQTSDAEFPGDWVLAYRLPKLEDEELRRDLMTAAPHVFSQAALLEAAGLPAVEGAEDRHFVPENVRIIPRLGQEQPEQ